MNQEPSPCYCLRMRKASLAVSAFYNRILAPSKVTSRQYFLLASIGRLGSCSVRELAELDRSTLSRSLKPLREQGMVADQKVGGAKSSRLELTDQGRAALSEALELWQKAQSSLAEQIGPEGLEALEKTFAALTGLNVP